VTVGEYRYAPAWWLPGGHLQTLWGKFAAKTPLPPSIVERLKMPDGDHVELHTVGAPTVKRRLLMLHGLEGTINSHYVRRTLALAATQGWGATLMVFRGCGTTPNTARRFYHSGETTDLDRVFQTLHARWPAAAWHVMGVSLGGNVMLKWLGEGGDKGRVRSAVAVSVPFDLGGSARQIATAAAGIYDRNFLRTLRQKALVKLDRYPDLFDRETLLRARTVFDFDDCVTAPVHGFGGADDYYTKSSSLGFLSAVRVPTLLLSAEDDPFMPRTMLARVAAVALENPSLRVEFHRRGGHVGFVAGWLPGSPRYYAEQRAFRFFDDQWVDTARAQG
jgi:predicted alpha/beta-fold hydrolase